MVRCLGRRAGTNRRFSAEALALDRLCGAVLAVAEKALELYAPERSALADLPFTLKPWQTRHCVGRSVGRPAPGPNRPRRPQSARPARGDPA